MNTKYLTGFITHQELKYILKITFGLLFFIFALSVSGFSQCEFAPSPTLFNSYTDITSDQNITASGSSNYYACSGANITNNGTGVHNYWLESGSSYTQGVAGSGSGIIFALNNNVIDISNGSGSFTIYAGAGSTVTIGAGVNTVYAECGATVINNSASSNIYYDCIDNITENVSSFDLIQCLEVSLNYPDNPFTLLDVGGEQYLDCDDFPILLDASSHPGPYLWSTGETTATISAEFPGVYTCTVPSMCESAIGTAILTLNNPVENVFLGTTLDYCFEELPITLDAGPGYNSYLWSTGETTQTISVDSFSTYNVETEGNCANGEGQIIMIGFVEPYVEDFEDSFDGCTINYPLTINAGNYNWYDWSTGENTQTIEVNSLGIYDVTVSNYCGAVDYSLDLNSYVTPPSISFPPNQDLCDYQFPVMLDATDVFDSYEWTTGESSSAISVPGPGTYGATVTNDCGTGYDEITFTSLGDAPALDLGGTIEVCNADFPYTIDAGAGYDSYLWSTGETSQTIEVNSAQTINVEVTNDCGSDSDEVIITEIIAPYLDLGMDIFSCDENFPVTLTPGAYESYDWSTGENTPTVDISSPEDITLTVSNACGFDTDNILISSLGSAPTLDLGEDQSYCNSEFPFTLDAGTGFDFYEWGSGETISSIEISGAGMFSVEVSNQCGVAMDEINISSSGDEPLVDLGPTQNICLDDFPVSLSPGIYDSYVWSTDEITPTISVSSPQTISVTVTTTCGEASSSVVISSAGETPELDLGEDLDYCNTDFPITFSAPAGYGSYNWSNGEITQDILLTFPQAITLDVGNQCGTDTDEITISTLGDAPNLDLGPDDSYCEADFPVTLDAGIFDTYDWSTGEDSQQISLNGPESITVTVTNVCGQVSDVINISSLGSLPVVDLGEDVGLCSDQFPIVLDAGTSGDTYEWSTGEFSETIEISESDVISVDVTNQCGTTTDNIFITSAGDAPVLDLGVDISLCEEEFPYIISPVGEFDSYVWSTSEETPTISINSAQEISLEVTNACGIDSDHLIISSLGSAPSLDFPDQLTYCEGDFPIILEVSEDYDTYDWSLGSTTNTQLINDTQSIELEVSNICGTVSDDVEIIAATEETESITLSLCENSSVHFNSIEINNPGSYDFFDPDGGINSCGLNSEVEVLLIPHTVDSVEVYIDEGSYYSYEGELLEEEGEYSFYEELENGCFLETHLTLLFTDLEYHVYVPSAFTPDQSGLNEVFNPKIYLGNHVLMNEFQFSIYNRWGKQVYTSEDYENCSWTGNDQKTGEHYVPDGVYSWVLSFTTSANVATESYTGMVTIIR